jgi:hypothetical protein
MSDTQFEAPCSDARFEAVLARICADPALEVEWLDMLSQLEYAGCRKIVKAVPFERVSMDVLKHVMEESSHAFLLKSQVEKMGVVDRRWTECPLTEMGWTYFQTLDHGVSAFEPTGFRYPAVSWIVEQRVLDVYPRYVAATRSLGVKRVLTRILAQEKHHSTLFGDEDFTETFKRRAKEWEAGLWSDFVTALEGWLDAQATSVRAAANTAAVSVSA